MSEADFTARVGGVLIAPRAAMTEAARAPVGQGTADVAWLVAARLVANHAPQLVRALLRGLDLGVMAAVGGVLVVVRSALPDVLLILIAGVVMSLLCGRDGRHAQTRATALDVAAYAWVPYCAVKLVAELGVLATRAEPSERARLAIDGVALAWMAAVWAVGLNALRARGPEPS